MGQSGIRRVQIDEKREHVYIPCSKEHLELMQNVNRSYNRQVDFARVEEYKERQIQLYRGTGRVMPIGVIVLCDLHGTYYSIDGSHRLKVFEDLIQAGYESRNTYLTFEIITAYSKNDIEFYFGMYNKGVEMPQYMFGSSIHTIDLIKQCISKLWKSKISKSRSHQHKSINLDQFGDFLEEYNLVPYEWNEDECRAHLKNWNEKAKELLNKTSKAMILACTGSEFYLGLYRGNEEAFASLITQN